MYIIDYKIYRQIHQTFHFFTELHSTFNLYYSQEVHFWVTVLNDFHRSHILASTMNKYISIAYGYTQCTYLLFWTCTYWTHRILQCQFMGTYKMCVQCTQDTQGWWSYDSILNWPEKMPTWSEEQDSRENSAAAFRRRPTYYPVRGQPGRAKVILHYSHWKLYCTRKLIK